jgi:hypothetical protein
VVRRKFTNSLKKRAEVRTGLRLNTSVEYYRIALFVVLMSVTIIVITGTAITK